MINALGAYFRAKNGAWGSRWRLYVILALCGLASLGAWWYFFRPKATIEPPLVTLIDADAALVQAIEEARTAVKKTPNSAGAWGHLGMLLFAHTLIPEAEICLLQAAKLDPHDGQWAYLYGLILVRTNPEEGIEKLEQAARLCGSIPAPRLKLGEVLLAEGRLDEAENHFRAVLENDSDNPRAELGLGRVAHARGQWEKSLYHLKRSAARAPGVRSTHAVLAEVYQRLGNATAANQELEWMSKASDRLAWPDPYVEAVERLKTGVEARVNLARNFLQQRRVNEAMALMQEMVQSQPDSDAVHLAYGFLLLQVNAAVAAEAEFREAERLRPDSVRTRAGLGLALLQQEKFQEAASCFRAALQLNPQQASAHYNLGICLRRLGARAEAIQAFRTAVKCKPDLAAAHRDLGELLAEEGEFAEAAGHLQDAVRLAPADKTAKELLARVRQQANRLDKH
jgi:tetratricopeptide (TPR) repeat protein